MACRLPRRTPRTPAKGQEVKIKELCYNDRSRARECNPCPAPDPQRRLPVKADTTITTESEVWKPVVGYEGIYEVSSEGRIRSLHRQVRHGASGASRVCVGIRTMSPANKRGYSVVSLSKNNKATTLTVHRIVATAFLERRRGVGEIVLPTMPHRDTGPVRVHASTGRGASVDHAIWKASVGVRVSPLQV